MRRRLTNQHAIAVAVEAVVRFDGVAIGAENIFAAGERGDHGKKAGLWEMEICEELADGAEWLSWIEEN